MRQSKQQQQQIVLLQQSKQQQQQQIVFIALFNWNLISETDAWGYALKRQKWFQLGDNHFKNSIKLSLAVLGIFPETYIRLVLKREKQFR